MSQKKCIPFRVKNKNLILIIRLQGIVRLRVCKRRKSASVINKLHTVVLIPRDLLVTMLFHAPCRHCHMFRNQKQISVFTETILHSILHPIAHVFCTSAACPKSPPGCVLIHSNAQKCEIFLCREASFSCVIRWGSERLICRISLHFLKCLHLFSKLTRGELTRGDERHSRLRTGLMRCKTLRRLWEPHVSVP